MIETTTTKATEPVCLSVEEAAAVMSVGRTMMFGLVISGEVPSFKRGRRRLVPLEGLRDWARKQSGIDEAQAGSDARSAT